VSVECAIVNAQPEDEAEARLIEWLSCSTPADWHRSAWTFNWDRSLYPLYWIVSQPNCDKGTAIYIFHQCGPDYYHNSSEFEALLKDDFRYNALPLMVEISQRWIDGRFQQYRFSPLPNPADRFHEIETARLQWPVADELANPSYEGQSLRIGGFDEGYPEALLDDFDAEGLEY
jgi:hypothetical protein